MKRVSMPFRPGLQVRRNGQMHEIKHVDVGSNRLQLKASSDGSLENLQLHEEFRALYDGVIQVYDELGVLLDFSEHSADVLRLSPKQLAAFKLRVAFTKKLDVLGAVGPTNPLFVDTVGTLNKEHKAQVSAPTAYAWLMRYRNAGSFRALAAPRSSLEQRRKSRMNPIVRQALDQVLDQEATYLEQRLKDQRSKLKIRGRTHLSLCSITLNAQAKVQQLHLEQHKKLNATREADGLAPLPLPSVPPGPSKRTVQMEVCGAFSRHKLLASVYGPHVAKRALGPFGNSFKLTRICERWETDVFLADIILTVMYQGVAVPVGIPYLTVIVDCYSGVVLAIVIEFKPPNYRSFLAALKQAYTPKDWLFEAFPGIRNRFAAHGAAEVIAYDNAGMFFTKEVQQAEAALSILLEPAEPRSPNDKPFIEGFGAVINRTFLRYQVGNKHSIERARALEYDAWKQPAMPIEEFARRLFEWAWNDLHERPMEDRHGWSRRQTWAHSLQSLAHSDDAADLFILDKKVIELEIADRHELAYTDEGFALDGRHYRSPEMHEVAMKFPKKYKFDVREDVGNPKSVRVVLTNGGKVIEVPAASEVPSFLTSNSFRQLADAKAQMANKDLQTFAAATREHQEPFRRDTSIEPLPTSARGLQQFIARRKRAEETPPAVSAPASQPADTPASQRPASMREALKKRLNERQQ